MRIDWNCDQETLRGTIVRPSPHKLRIVCMGQCGFILTYGGRTVSADVVYSDLYYQGTRQSRRQIPPPFPKEQVPWIDLFLVSHDHADHEDTEFLRWRMEDERVRMIAPDCVLSHYGRRYEPVEGITPIEVAHEEYRYDAHGKPECYGYVVDTPAGAIFHAGDAVLTEKLTNDLLGLHKHFKMLMLPINGRGRPGIIGNMNIDEAISLALNIQPDYLVPTHWDLFKENGADISLFVDKANAAGLSYLIPRPGEVWCFD